MLKASAKIASLGTFQIQGQSFVLFALLALLAKRFHEVSVLDVVHFHTRISLGKQNASHATRYSVQKEPSLKHATTNRICNVKSAPLPQIAFILI
jgi:hypothetical protein